MKWFYIIFVGIMLLILIYFFVIKNEYIPEDTIYFYIIDQKDNKSIKHDSGIKPSTLESNTSTSLQIIKNEINDGKVNYISFPITLVFGRHPKDINNKYLIESKSVTEEEDYYTITIPSKILK